MAPEVFSQDYDYKCDLWSIGVILFIMLSGRPPFIGKNEEAIKTSIMKGEYSFQSKITYKIAKEWECVSPEAKDLIKNLLVMDREKRYNCLQALESPWMTKYTSNQVSDNFLTNNIICNLIQFHVCVILI